MSTTINPNKPLGEGRLHSHCRNHARERRGARQSLGITEDSTSSTSASGDGTTALPAAKLGANVLGVDIASNLVEAGNDEHRASASPTADSKKATHPISANSRTTASTSSSAASARCSLRGRSTWQKSSCV